MFWGGGELIIGILRYITTRFQLVTIFLLFSECKTPIGVESSYLHRHGAVKDAQITASSADADYPARFARYRHTSAWCANQALLEDPVIAKSQYLQIDLLKLKKITAIATEGLGSSSFVKDFFVYYATDPGAFRSLRHGENNEKIVRYKYMFVNMIMTSYDDHIYEYL